MKAIHEMTGDAKESAIHFANMILRCFCQMTPDKLRIALDDKTIAVFRLDDSDIGDTLNRAKFHLHAGREELAYNLLMDARDGFQEKYDFYL